MMSEAQIIEGRKITASIGSMVALLSFGMLFASLFLGLAIYRFNSPSWPPMGIKRPDLSLPILSTLIILASSFFMGKFSKKARRVDFYFSILLGFFFLLAQYFLWQKLKAAGLYSSSGIYGSLIYALTWVHAGHVILGLIFMIIIVPFISNIESKNIFKIRSIAKFWHFLAFVWILMLFFLFIF